MRIGVSKFIGVLSLGTTNLNCFEEFKHRILEAIDIKMDVIHAGMS